MADFINFGFGPNIVTGWSEVVGEIHILPIWGLALHMRVRGSSEAPDGPDNLDGVDLAFLSFEIAEQDSTWSPTPIIQPNDTGGFRTVARKITGSFIFPCNDAETLPLGIIDTYDLDAVTIYLQALAGQAGGKMLAISFGRGEGYTGDGAVWSSCSWEFNQATERPRLQINIQGIVTLGATQFALSDTPPFP